MLGAISLKLSIMFDKTEEYVFFFENVHLLLVDFNRDDRKDLYIIKEQTEQGLLVEYPGQLFTDQVMDVISHVFFIRAQEEDSDSDSRFILGAYFEAGDSQYGAYYEMGEDQTRLIFFGIVPEDDHYKVVALPDEEYHRVAQEFSTTYAGLLDFQ